MNKIIKLSKKKRRLRNISKRKLNKNNQKPKMVTIGSLDNLDKEDLPISIPKSIFDKSIIDVAMIGADVYHATCKLIRA